MKIGFFTLLTLIFVVLKLCKVIAWSWFWVFSPVWIAFLIAILVFIGVIIVTFVANR